MNSVSIENYLKAIIELESLQATVSTGLLAQKLNFKPASVTGMLKKMAADRLVVYEPYRGVELTARGRKEALLILRKHRIIELFLVKIIGVDWSEVHEEAEHWEHVVSDSVLEKIDKLLENPKNDPHGSPIPSVGGKLSSIKQKCLNKLEPGDEGIVSELDDSDPDKLKHFKKFGLIPGERIKITEMAPFDGPIKILIGGKRKTIGYNISSYIFVKKAK